MNSIPIELWSLIFEFLDYKSQLNFLFTTKKFRERLHLTRFDMPFQKRRLKYYDLSRLNSFFNSEFKYTDDCVGYERSGDFLSECILRRPVFSGLTQLDLSGNEKVKDVSFLKHLTVLKSDSVVNIKGIDLYRLDVRNNYKINDISFLKNLKILNVGSQLCSICQKHIMDLDLIELNASDK